jgi:hypothetical protein
MWWAVALAVGGKIISEDGLPIIPFVFITKRQNKR